MNLLRIRRLLQRTGREAVILLFALGHPATPRVIKLATLAAFAYLLSPVDLIPDIPLIGWIDDAVLIGLAVPMLLRRLPARALHESTARAQGLLSRLMAGWRRYQ